MKNLYQVKNINALITIYKLIQKSELQKLAHHSLSQNKLNQPPLHVWVGPNSRMENIALFRKQAVILSGNPLLTLNEQHEIIEHAVNFLFKIQEEDDDAPVFDNPRLNPVFVSLSDKDAQKYALFLEPVQNRLDPSQTQDENVLEGGFAKPILSLYTANNNKMALTCQTKTVADIKKEIRLLNFNFLLRQAIEQKKHPLLSFPPNLYHYERNDSYGYVPNPITEWKLDLKEKFSFKKESPTLEPAPKKSQIPSDIWDVISENTDFFDHDNALSDDFLDFLDSIDSLDTTLTAEQILNKKIELELRLREHTSVHFRMR